MTLTPEQLVEVIRKAIDAGTINESYARKERYAQYAEDALTALCSALSTTPEGLADRNSVIDECAKACDESLAEANRLYAETNPTDQRLRASRNSWGNTSRMLADQIRALKTGKEEG